MHRRGNLHAAGGACAFLGNSAVFLLSELMMETTLRNTITKNRLKRLEREMRSSNQVLSRHEMDIKQLKAWMEEQSRTLAL